MPTAQPLRTGDPHRLGVYELAGRLGEGGQGAVFLGSKGGERYAVKLLHGPVGEEQAAFLREVELAKHVARFCTAQVIDAGFDEGRPYIVSEYVDGPSLHREVMLTGPRRGGALERLAVGTATALAAIHRAGIVHRDFKPQNVLLGSDGPRVIDFGLARALDAAATVTNRGVGTPAYMAPEQITASAVTGAADVFSWGATMCFAANASAPFGQDSVAPVLHRILTAAPELGRLDGRLRVLVAACLDKDAKNRPSSRELLFSLLGESDEVPVEVLTSPPPGVVYGNVPLVPEPRSPVPLAEPEATGAAAAYHLPDSLTGQGSGSRSGSRSGTGVTGDGPATGPVRRKKGWAQAVIAVCAALLVTGGVLLTVIVPAITKDSRASEVVPSAAVPSEPVASVPTVVTSPPVTAKPTSDGRDPRVDPTVARPVTTVRVPVVTGLGRAAAVKAVRAAGLTVGRIIQLDSPQKIGQVLGSMPASGTAVGKGGPVSLRVSAGLPVPAVAGRQRKAAEAALTGAGLAVGAVTRACSGQPNGQVLSTRPQAGRRVPGGTPVALTVARNGVAVPSVVGRPRADGRAALVAAGFVVKARGQIVDDESKADLVLSQSVAPGSCATAGDVVVIIVGLSGQSGGPGPEEPTPSPTDSAAGQA